MEYKMNVKEAMEYKMNVKEAMEPTGKISAIYCFPDVYAQLYENTLWWFSIETNERQCPVPLDYILEEEIDWQPYNPIEEIRPEKPGELWKVPNQERYYHTELRGVELIVCDYEGYTTNFSRIIHNQNGWKRVHPIVEVKNIDKVQWVNVKDRLPDENIEIDNITFNMDGGGCKVYIKEYDKVKSLPILKKFKKVILVPYKRYIIND